MRQSELVAALQELYPHDLAVFEYNGLLTEDLEKNISKVGITLGFSKQAIEKALKANIDFLIVHNAPEELELRNSYYQEIKSVIDKNNMSIYRLHLPMDFAKDGLIDLLCQKLGLVGRSARLQYHSFVIEGGVYVIQKKITLSNLLKKVSLIAPKSIRIVKGRKKIQKIAITTGDGCKPEFLLQLDPDVFVCGLLNQEAIRVASDMGITLIEATSYATENEPLKHVAKKLQIHFPQLSIVFLDVIQDIDFIIGTKEVS